MFKADELNRLYRYCYSLTRQRDEAYDLLQTAIEKFLRQRPPAPEDLVRYMRQIIRHQYIDDYRRKRRFPMESLEDVDPVDFDTQTLDQMMMDQQSLEIAWKWLQAEERELLYLWAVENQTAQQIADELAQPRGTILSRIHRIRKKLLNVMNETPKSSEGRKL